VGVERAQGHETALVCACDGGHVDVVQWLLRETAAARQLDSTRFNQQAWCSCHFSSSCAFWQVACL
jgi:hypothetical protein